MQPSVYESPVTWVTLVRSDGTKSGEVPRWISQPVTPLSSVDASQDSRAVPELVSTERFEGADGRASGAIAVTMSRKISSSVSARAYSRTSST